MPVKKLSPRFLVPPWEEVLEEFILFKKAEGRAPRTVEDYNYWLRAFFNTYGSAWPDYNELRKAVRMYFKSLADRSAATFNINRAYLKHFFRWCISEGYLDGNPVDGIAKRKDEGIPRNIDEETVKKLLAAVDRTTYTGLRDYALILLQLDTGIRPGEALQLTEDCFDLARLEVFIPASVAKTRQERVVVISMETARAIKKLLAVRPREWKDNVPVFASQDGKEMHERSWAGRMRYYSRKIGIRVTPYSLRHTAAIMSLRNGGSAFFVQKQLGHKTLTMTRRYVHLVEADLHREHTICSPVASITPHVVRAKRNIKDLLAKSNSDD